MKSVWLIPLFFLSTLLQAEVTGSSSYQDERNKMVAYDPLQVTKIIGAYGVATTIVFEEGEYYIKHAAGNSSSFAVVPVENTVSIKPLFYDAVTNVNVFTNKRLYVFEIDSMTKEEARRSTNLTYSIRFTYPNSNQADIDDHVTRQEEREEARKLAEACAPNTDLVDPTSLNHAYEFAGSGEIAPIVVFDDGIFMYLQFSKHAALPAVFGVNRDRSEFSLNTRMEGDFLIIEQLLPEISLRLNELNVSVRKISQRAHSVKAHTSEVESKRANDDW